MQVVQVVQIKFLKLLKWLENFLGDSTHIRLHTHETAGVSVVCYLAALEAGADGIDLGCKSS